ncbi:MAG TPA: hypothetical protein VD905_05020 [Flavobacteriales bacterium]|nr:hypothetical protein [Flavobacteriales bacterium]
MTTQRKRSPKEILKWAAFLKKKKNEEISKRAQKILKAARIAVVFLIIVNTLLCIDLLVLKSQTRYDTIEGIESYYARRRRGTSKRSFVLHTTSGRYWEITNRSGYETYGAKLRFRQTPLFRITFDLYNQTHGTPIAKSYDGRNTGKYVSVIFLLVALVSFFTRALRHERYTILGITVIVMMVGEAVCLLLF